jgi:hypothetical protein
VGRCSRGELLARKGRRGRGKGNCRKKVTPVKKGSVSGWTEGDRERQTQNAHMLDLLHASVSLQAIAAVE